MFLQANAKGDGPPIAFVHGALHDARFWEPQLAALSARGFRPIALELEGFFPDSFDPERFSAERHIQAISRFLGDYGRPVHVVAHSRGARLMMVVANRAPEAIASLVLVEAGGAREPGFFGDAPVAQHAPPQSNGLRLLDEGDVDGALKDFMETGMGKGAWDRAPELFKSMARQNARTLHGMAADKGHPISRAVAAGVRAPTLLIDGTASPPIFGKVNEVLEQVIPGARRIRFETDDHFLMLSQAERFNAVVAEFVSEHEPRTTAVAANG